jgi:hypothetical protein
MPDQSVQVKYVDQFIVPLLVRVGLKVKVTRKPDHTTLRIELRRADKDA